MLKNLRRIIELIERFELTMVNDWNEPKITEENAVIDMHEKVVITNVDVDDIWGMNRQHSPFCYVSSAGPRCSRSKNTESP